MLYRLRVWLADHTRMQYPQVRRSHGLRDPAPPIDGVERAGLFVFGVWAVLIGAVGMAASGYAVYVIVSAL